MPFKGVTLKLLPLQVAVLISLTAGKGLIVSTEGTEIELEQPFSSVTVSNTLYVPAGTLVKLHTGVLVI